MLGETDSNGTAPAHDAKAVSSGAESGASPAWSKKPSGIPCIYAQLKVGLHTTCRVSILHVGQMFSKTLELSFSESVHPLCV